MQLLWGSFGHSLPIVLATHGNVDLYRRLAIAHCRVLLVGWESAGQLVPRAWQPLRKDLLVSPANLRNRAFKNRIIPARNPTNGEALENMSGVSRLSVKDPQLLEYDAVISTYAFSPHKIADLDASDYIVEPEVLICRRW